MSFREVLIDSPVEEKIKWAESCYHEKKELFLGDDSFADLLSAYKDAALASNMAMIEAGVVEECKDCEEREGGSCCGAGIENRYSGGLLLINLLLERKIPKKSINPLSCRFLGKNGCELMARHIICVNYLCKKITDRIDPKYIAVLREKEGIELERLFLLNERIKGILSEL